MATIGIPFTEETYGMITREARKKNIQPETLLKIWILERAKEESVKSDVVPEDPIANILALPLKVGLMLTVSATATITTLAEELAR